MLLPMDPAWDVSLRETEMKLGQGVCTWKHGDAPECAALQLSGNVGDFTGMKTGTNTGSRI